MRFRPLHRPPRVPADRHPHCAWTVEIDPDSPDTPTPRMALRMAESVAGRLPLAVPRGDDGDGDAAYRGPLDPDLRLERFSSATLRAVIDEVCLQGHLLALSFGVAVADRLGPDEAASALARQLTGVAGVAAERLARAFGLGDAADDVATAFELHPAFHPRSYVDWRVSVDAGDAVLLELHDCPALDEAGFASWITVLAQGEDRVLGAVAAGVDPHWTVRPDGARRWRVERAEEPAPELGEVTVTKFSAGARFAFTR